MNLYSARRILRMMAVGLRAAFPILGALLIGSPHPAAAQDVPLPPVNFYGSSLNAPSSQYLYVDVGSNAPGGNCCGQMSVQQLANASYNAAVGTMGQQLAATAAVLDASMQRQAQTLSQGIAMASAMTVLPPNPGDRFSINLGGSGFNGQGAGAITGTARLSDNAVAFFGYARSQSQNLVKGGISFSIH